jgi:hypothetical protein
MTPKQAACALRALAESVDAGTVSMLERLALSIDGPSKKKKPSKGGKSAPTVTLSDVGATESGCVRQEWSVYANGQKASVVSVTDEKGDVQISGEDLDLDEGGLTSQQAVAFILQGADPRYYPKPGKTVTLDAEFIDGASSISP